MPRHIITLLALAALVTACSGYAPGTFRGYPLLKRSEPTVLLASTSNYETNPADPSQSKINGDYILDRTAAFPAFGLPF